MVLQCSKNKATCFQIASPPQKKSPKLKHLKTKYREWLQNFKKYLCQILIFLKRCKKQQQRFKNSKISWLKETFEIKLCL